MALDQRLFVVLPLECNGGGIHSLARRACKGFGLMVAGLYLLELFCDNTRA
jgi:hypothetical protein